MGGKGDEKTKCAGWQVMIHLQQTRAHLGVERILMAVHDKA